MKKIFIEIKSIIYYFVKKERFIKLFSRKNFKNSFFSFHFRPKKTEEIIDDSVRIKNKFDKIGIVIQGPLKLENDFTYETIKYYKKVYSECIIILSTWEDERKNVLEKIEELGVRVIRNEKPLSGDINNFNYQIISTREGIKVAEKMKCKYILKTRTDFRIYDTGIDKFLISLLETYPSNNINQNKRIIGIGLNIRFYDPSFSDLFQFGTIEEIKRMWNIDLNSDNTAASIYENINKDKYEEYMIKYSSIERYNNVSYPEGYILKNYLNSLNVDIGKNLENYYKVLKDNFIIIDMEMINLYWDKYSKDEYKGFREYKGRINKKRMRFKDWQTIYYYDVAEMSKDIYSKSTETLSELTIIDFE